ncbi:MAG: hypothetical protein IT448_09580 [Phycisphaerales bacterium]|nr:hypothetical protein [Phycisphaerales bacterium]
MTSAPVAALLQRLSTELPDAFVADKALRISRAPGRLDVMGGITEYSGGQICQMGLGQFAAVAVQERDDRQIQAFSFNRYDENQPFTFGISIDDLIRASDHQLRSEFSQPGRRWAAYMVGCLFVLHEQGYVDLKSPTRRGFNLAVASDIPMGAGLGSSAALEVASMIAVVDQLGIARSDQDSDGQGLQLPANANADDKTTLSPVALAGLCQQVENRLVGVPCGLADQLTSCYARGGELFRMVCQPHKILSPLHLPSAIRIVGINSGVTHAIGEEKYICARTSAFMGYRIILEKMKEMGRKVGRELVADPMRGYLANLNLEDYKRFFRQFLPVAMKGREFLQSYAQFDDMLTSIAPDHDYHIQGVTDHHVYEARRIANFIDFLQQAIAAPPHTEQRSRLLDKAGHLMYASNEACNTDAHLGSSECELLVELVRKHEKAGLYGGRISASGIGGTVVVLANISSAADEGLEQIMREYHAQTGRTAQLISGSGTGAWHCGTAELKLAK